MKKALLVGINKFPDAPLRGCINDVKNMMMAIPDYGFSPLSIKTLVNEEATKENILNCLNDMIVKAKEGDNLVFHFSSHGSQVPDRDGDEADGLDEILCPYGFDWEPERYIMDDEIRDILKNLNEGATIDVFLDCCHSGTATREVDITSKFIPFPIPLSPSMKVMFPFLKEMMQPNVALWAGCKSNQTSADAYIEGKYQGAMTWAFCESLKYGGHGTRDKVHKLLKRIIHDGDYEQIPQLETSENMREKLIFS